MDGGTAVARVLTVGERSYKKEIEKLLLSDGETFHGEGILAITKALLQSGISYVGGYPGAPMSHLIDVLADASEEILKPMGIHYEQSASEAGAAALLSASIGYPHSGRRDVEISGRNKCSVRRFVKSCLLWGGRRVSDHPR